MAELVCRESVPGRLVDCEQWVCWREVERDGKLTKIPIDPVSGKFASTTDPDTWGGFETACETVESGTEDGVGFVFTESDPFVGVDLDDCRDPESGRPEEWAKDVIESLDSFTEVSPSGTGYHVLVAGSLPEGRNRKDGVEVYEMARFFTVTGDHVDGTPAEIKEREAALGAVYAEYVGRDDAGGSVAGRASNETGGGGSLGDEALVEKAKGAANGKKFEALFRGSTSGYASQSEADMALCSLLAFWTGGDARQMDRVFRESGLMREKWDEQHYADGSTYGEKTIERAIDGTSEFYQPPDDAPAPATSSEEAASVSGSGDSGTRARQRLERIEELEEQLSEVLEKNAALAAELEAERARRNTLEEELDAARASDGSVLGWLSAVLGG